MYITFIAFSLFAAVFGADEKLEILTTTRFSYSWCIANGCTARRDGSFYRPVCPPSFYPLGDYGWSGAGCPNPDGRVTALCVRAISPSALAKPANYEGVWFYKGPPAKEPVGFWRPTAPPGFKCLGSVVRGGSYDKPSVNEVRCVAESLVIEGQLGPLIYNDQGTLAGTQLAAYEIVPDQLKGLYAGTFVAVNRYDLPKEAVYVLATSASSSANCTR